MARCTEHLEVCRCGQHLARLCTALSAPDHLAEAMNDGIEQCRSIRRR